VDLVAAGGAADANLPVIATNEEVELLWRSSVKPEALGRSVQAAERPDQNENGDRYTQQPQKQITSHSSAPVQIPRTAKSCLVRRVPNSRRKTTANDCVYKRPVPGTLGPAGHCPRGIARLMRSRRALRIASCGRRWAAWVSGLFYDKGPVVFVLRVTADVTGDAE